MFTFAEATLFMCGMSYMHNELENVTAPKCTQTVNGSTLYEANLYVL